MPWDGKPDVIDDNGDGWDLDPESNSWEPHIDGPVVKSEPKIESE